MSEFLGRMFAYAIFVFVYLITVHALLGKLLGLLGNVISIVILLKMTGELVRYDG